MSKGIDDIDNSWYIDEQFDFGKEPVVQTSFTKPYTFNQRKSK